MLQRYINQIQEGVTPSHYITIECTEQAAKDTLLPLLEYLKRQAGIGHSFPIVVDPDDSEYREKFYMDGDGAAHIISIESKVGSV